MVRHGGYGEQGDIIVPEGWWWERVVLAVWMLMTLVLTRSYAGNLMALLAVRHIPEPYQTIGDFLDDSSVTMIWQTGSSIKRYLYVRRGGMTALQIQASTGLDDLEKEGRITYRRAADYPQIIDTLVRRGDHVLMEVNVGVRVYMAEDFARTGRCSFYSSREEVQPNLFAMIGQQDSPLVPSISRRIRKMTEAGLFYQWLKMQDPKSTLCDHEPNKITVTSSLALSNLWGMFVILGSGFITSLCLLCLEHIIAGVIQS
ncbi:Ionotropic receptor 93a-like 13 [Homarus americanus]|uniref:Ionotropic receptor 93a-like 13 n=1 Tax=Homarus americanus TaxID=6706 RepID=A0A8J5JUH7_HOMAM|nr:Ionotropic receptor 93a-like 13 [Homarus americanus]